MSINQPLLPSEILEQIFSYLASYDTDAQHTLYLCTLVSRSWYSNSIPFLYDSPGITGKNFDSFVRAVCPSVNAHVRTNGLAELVRMLDMSRLVHNGSKSLTARILGRVKRTLEGFVAPQASFAVNSLAALSKCTNLRHLNLSFVSEYIDMTDLLRSTCHLLKLESLRLPRSSTCHTEAKAKSKDISKACWPANLQELYISSGLNDSLGPSVINLPSTLLRLSISDCSRLSMQSIAPALERLSPNLRCLALIVAMPAVRTSPKPFNSVLSYVPKLTHLKISLDLIDADFFIVESDRATRASLKRLDLHCFDPEECHYLMPIGVYGILGLGMFEKIRIIGVHSRLGWGQGIGRDDLVDIDELLKALAREDGAGAEIPEAEAGVRRIPEKAFWVWTGRILWGESSSVPSNDNSE